MTRYTFTCGLLGVALLSAACADSTPTAPSPPLSALDVASGLPAPGARGFTVMTWNAKFGGDLIGVARSTAPVPDRWAELWADVQEQNFPERAGAIARQIAASSPALIGLQEMALFRMQDPGDAFEGDTPATTDVLDFLAILQDSLEARGLSYYVAAEGAAADIELPASVPGNSDRYIDIRYIDRNVILARSDIVTSHTAGATYAATVNARIGPFTRQNLRGWVSVEAFLGGVTYRFVTTHLENSRFVTIQEPQARELIQMLAAETLPVILVCDCNTRADGTSTQSYGWLVGTGAEEGGFVDAWSEAEPNDPGYTSRLPESLFGPALLTERIDLILVRQGFGTAAAAGIVGGVRAMVIGEEPGDQTPSGRWPSDHAGVVGVLHLPAVLVSQ